MPTPIHTCVLFALKRERLPFCRIYRPTREIHGAPCWAQVCASRRTEILVLETGVGPKRVNRVLDWLLVNPPSRIVMAGFCGGLRSHLSVGDVVIPAEIVDEDHRVVTTAWPSANRRGRLLTMSKLIGDPAEKTRLAERFDADAVDMESAVVAKRCTDAGIPFACVRAVSDDSRTALSPQLVSLLSSGRVSFGKTAVALARRPSMVAEMMRLAKHTRLAAQRLAHALAELLSGSGDAAR